MSHLLVMGVGFSAVLAFDSLAGSGRCILLAHLGCHSGCGPLIPRGVGLMYGDAVVTEQPREQQYAESRWPVSKQKDHDFTAA
jgi:hypothetical protein